MLSCPRYIPTQQCMIHIKKKRKDVVFHLRMQSIKNPVRNARNLYESFHVLLQEVYCLFSIHIILNFVLLIDNKPVSHNCHNQSIS